MSIVYLNGSFMQQEKASIPITDRGFLFADSIYEVIPVFQNKMVAMMPHLQRLEKSLQAIHIKNPLSLTEWEDILYELLALNKSEHRSTCIYIQVTRGTQPTRGHAIPTDIEPTVLVMCYDFPQKTQEELLKGMHAVTLEDRRRADCFIKATSLLPNVLAYHQATENNAHEAILIRNKKAQEGTSSNLFIVKNGTLITPPLSPNILGGVTRSIILSLAASNAIPHKEMEISEKELFAADEVWLTGSMKSIYPIVQIDKQAVGNGTPGTLWHKMDRLYHHYKLTGQVTKQQENLTEGKTLP